MASLLVVLIIAGCVAYQYLKGTVVKAFATIIITICASVVAFGYFEVLANVFVSRSGDTRYLTLVLWAQPLCFALLFILTFAILQTIAAMLTRHPVDLGLLPERIGCVVCGIFLGLLLSGLLLTALAMAPLPNKYPYQRFDQRSLDAQRPSKPLPNADGFATGWFTLLSKGSFSGKRSFAALHPNFLDQVFLNRHNVADEIPIPIITSSQAIELPKKNQMAACWLAPRGIKDSQGSALQKTGYDLTIVRVGIKRSALKNAGKFTLSQLRLICKEKLYAKDPLTGKAKNVYPVGYLTTANQLKKTRLNEPIRIERSHFAEKERVKWIDFAFYVPSNSVPVLLQFKLNSIAQVPTLVPTDQAPPPAPFVMTSEKKKDAEKPDKPSERQRFSPPGRSETPPRRGRLGDVGRSIIGDEFDEDE